MYLSAHFTGEELNAAAAPPSQLPNLRALADLLEGLRAALGVPLRVTSGYRTPAQNDAAGGAEKSQHLTGAAADVVPVGLTVAEAYRRFRAADDVGRMPAYSQIIFYPADGHIHIGLPLLLTRWEQLVKKPTGYGQAHEFFGYPAPRRQRAGAILAGTGALLLLVSLALLLLLGGK